MLLLLFAISGPFQGPGIFSDSVGRQFLALVEFESKKKKRAAEAANKYLERLGDTVSRSEDSLLKNLRDLNAES